MNSAIDSSPAFRRKQSIRSSILDRWRASGVGKRKRTGVAPSGTAVSASCAPAQYETAKKMCFGQTNAGCEWYESESAAGTLNLAFEDFRDEERILEPILKNGDRTKRAVKSVTFGEESRVLRFADFKSSREFRGAQLNFARADDDSQSSTEDLLKRNYQLLTTDRRRDVESESRADGTPNGGFAEIALPVVSLYLAADRMPSRKKKSKDRTDVVPSSNRGNGGAWNAPEHPLHRSHRLARMVKKFGPEILSCMEDGGDSVLAQFMKSQELERIKEIEKAKWEEENKASPPVRKRKAREGVFGE